MSFWKHKEFTKFWHGTILFMLPIIILIGGVAVAVETGWKWAPFASGFIGSMIYWRLLDAFTVDRSELHEDS